MTVTVGDGTQRSAANDAAVAAAVAAFGGLDILVSCVGMFDFYRSITDLTGDSLDAAFDEIFRGQRHELPARGPGGAAAAAGSPGAAPSS